ncbi:hypothetical protein HDU85_000760 [Gaertneriomyces sp. JEL0708]|nr:hypothetical protein HDU85_000760 [Gaertneriomyces sp. JEL0708]
MASSSQGSMPDISALPNRNFYEILGVARDAENEVIRKAYRRKALQHHPDKVGSDPQAVEVFQLIQRAYEVLSDEKKRRLYDQYGERGILLTEQMSQFAPFIDPESLLMINTLFFMVALVAGLLIMFPAFLAARIDHKVSWSWPVTFIPLFIMDAILLCFLSDSGADNTDPDAEPSEFTEDRSVGQAERQRQARLKKLKQKNSKIGRCLAWICFLVFQIFVALRLQESIRWNWGLVFIPWFILEALFLASATSNAISTINEGKPEADLEADIESQVKRPLGTFEKILVFYGAYYQQVLRIIQAALIVAKVNGSLGASWGVIFLPTWLYAVFRYCSITLSCIMLKRSVPEEVRPKVIAFGCIMPAMLSLIPLFFLYLGVGLLVKRLDGNNVSPSAAVILIPVFILFGLIFCCACCVGPCVVCCMRNGLQAELNNNEEIKLKDVIGGDRRLTYPEPLPNMTTGGHS